MLRRWRSLKKIVYAAAILLLTIVVYATTISDGDPDVVDAEWKLPVVSDGTLRVDRALLEPLHRLPLGPFEDHAVPVIIETLKLKFPNFSDTKPHPTSGSMSANNKALALAKPPVGAAAKAPGGAVAAHPNAPIAKPAPAPAGNPVVPIAKKPPVGPAGSNNSPMVKQPVAVLKPKPPPPPPLLPTKPLPDLTKIAQKMDQRLAYTRDQCNKYKFPHEVDADVYVLAKHNVTYCKVPKSGSTYWEQVFSFLNKMPRELAYLRVKSPFQISKYDIRYTSHFTLPRHNWKDDNDRSMMMTTKRILFVRHPLERLWSSYMEKFYLIDFWSSLGLQIKTKGWELKCPKTITFREFIEFTLPIFNEFWAPITELCNPCNFEPSYIGHIETMREDTLYILKQCNLQWIFNDQEKFSRQESHMIDMVIYNYQIHSIRWYSFFHKCLSQRELAARLWDVFKKVGYLSSHATLPDNLPDYNQTTIINEIKIQVAKFPLDSKNGRAQLLKIMIRDYSVLPKPILAKILEKYAMDFQLFGYSTDIPTS